MKINILGDFRLLLEKMDLDMDFAYIFVVKKKEVQIGEDQTLESLDNIRKLVETGNKDMLEE